MVQILPEVPGFGSQLARGLGAGLSQGIEQSANFATQLGLEKFKQSERKKLIQDIRKRNTGNELAPQNQEDIKSKFIEALPQIEQYLGRELEPEEVNQFWQIANQGQQRQQPEQEDAFGEAEEFAIAGEPELSRISSKKAEVLSREKMKRETQGEPKLLEMEDQLRGYEESGMRFERLNELFAPEFEEKFPPSLLVGLFSKEGELRPEASALLSPEAQEAVKLIADELSGAKNTFGARVTNFDLQAYMKRLPTLLNTAEGRRRVLRDLRLINKINRLHDEGVLNVVDRYGGPGEISISKATRIFRKEFAPKMKQLREEFVHPEKAEFSEVPDASIYKGTVLQDTETGQKFRSNGKEWIPE